MNFRLVKNTVPQTAAALPVLTRIARGEEFAVEEFMRSYGNLVWALAKRFTNNSEDAEDAVQEIFIEIWQNAARYDAAKSAESTFITLIARRRLIDRLRKTYRQPQTQSIDNFFEVQIGAGSGDKQLQTTVEARQAVVAMKQLRPEQRNLMLMTIFEGLSHGEIAQLTGMPLGTVKTNIRRGFNRMREIMSIGAFGKAATV
jgi:RNA polymerase sigma-70 factor, ECF subfamily